MTSCRRLSLRHSASRYRAGSETPGCFSVDAAWRLVRLRAPRGSTADPGPSALRTERKSATFRSLSTISTTTHRATSSSHQASGFCSIGVYSLGARRGLCKCRRTQAIERSERRPLKEQEHRRAGEVHNNKAEHEECSRCPNDVSRQKDRLHGASEGRQHHEMEQIGAVRPVAQRDQQSRRRPPRFALVTNDGIQNKCDRRAKHRNAAHLPIGEYRVVVRKKVEMQDNRKRKCRSADDAERAAVRRPPR